ncbi:MAG TPA: adenine deaminase [Anaerolineales bacterium]|nr:adenine deaminase [Anaerolineales bacterium]
MTGSKHAMQKDWLTFTKELIDCAMGRTPAELVITNGQWVCVQSGEIIPHTDIAIRAGRIAYIGPSARHTIGEKTTQIDAQGKYLVPGLLDAHMHVESGMLTVTEFVRAVAPRGTTGMFIDPHEIANVFGLDGIKLMAEDALQQPIHVWVEVPSCVPSAPGLETPGSHLGPEEVAEAMTWQGIIGLGEMMNFPGVFNADSKMLAEMSATRAASRTIGGHYASPDLGLPFHGYVAGGAEDDHEITTAQEAIARVRQGMKAMMRLGSAWHDVAEPVKAITQFGLDSRNFILCTDDCFAATLLQEGHMDRVVRHAIQQGLPPLTAIQMATLNTAEHFGLSHEVGQLAPRRWADVLIVGNLAELKIETVIAKGQILAKGGAWQFHQPANPYPAWSKQSIHLACALQAQDFVLPAKDGKYTANVIGVIENQAPTAHLRFPVEAQNGQVQVDLKRDLAKIAVVERHRGEGRVQVGLVHGFGFSVPCGIASTVAHDSHQLIVIGTNESDMALAVNTLAECGGGQVVVKNGKVIGQVKLPIAGLISDEPAVVVAEQAATIQAGFQACGCKLNNPNMQHSLLALVVIPALRISDLGLVDVTKFEFIPVLEG